jgi:hypothetical protein
MKLFTGLVPGNEIVRRVALVMRRDLGPLVTQIL